jgi:nucleoside phosphorylase
VEQDGDGIAVPLAIRFVGVAWQTGMCGVRLWMAEDRADVLIIAALREELEAAKAAGLARSPGGPGVSRWEERSAGRSAPLWWGEYVGSGDRPWSVALARPTRMSGRLTAPTATNLVDSLRPSCLAMSGVCAGNPAGTALGDVVVAEVAYEWDEGKYLPAGFVGDHRQVPLDPRLLRVAQDFSPTALPSYGSASSDEAMLWLLERLYQSQDPRTHPARDCYFAHGTWRPWLAQWETEGLITRGRDEAVVITDTGRRLVQRRLYDDIDGPRRLPFRVLVAPMASGSAVVVDASIWPRLVQMGMREIAAVEMEAATIATVAREREVPHWIVVKGVMDHADIAKDDRYRRFAARASAEVLYALLDSFLPALPRAADASEPAPSSSPSAVYIVGRDLTLHGPTAGRDVRYG